VDAGGVLDRHERVELEPADAELLHGGRAVGEQALAELRIHPRLRDHPRAVLRAEVVLVVVDDGVDRVGREQALLHEQRLERRRAHRGVVAHGSSR
jgi:hypothetical protein